ncbi:hypothetical protein [Microbulbifer sp. A4B17]|nr:hypothetical protein [Microbulbifer sp. A4B17]
MSERKRVKQAFTPNKASLEKVAKGFERAKTKADKAKNSSSPLDYVEVK